jgi:hypothetical protein
VTTEQLIERAQKGQAAEERFQAAAKEAKENAAAIASHEDLRAVIMEGDIDALRRIGVAHGIPEDEIERIAARSMGGEKESDENVVEQYDREIQGQGTRSREGEPGPVSYDRLAPDIQRALRNVEQGRMEKIVREAIDSDKDLAYNIGRHSTEGQSAIRAMVDEKIRGRLASYGGDFGDGTHILAEILPEVKAHLQALGIPGARGPVGLGQSPGGGDTEVYPRKKPDHVSSQEGDAFEQNILETLAYHQSKAEEGRS